MAAYGRHPSAQFLQHDNDYFLIDCGEGTQFQLQKFKLKTQKIDHILISHLHGDHIFGLIGLLSSMNLLGRMSDLHLYGPKDLAEIVTLQLKYSNSVLNYRVEFHQLRSDKSENIFESKTLSVYSFPLNHRIECYGFKFVEKIFEYNLRKEKLPKQIEKAELQELKKGKNIYNSDKSLKYNYKDFTYLRYEPVSYAYCTDTRADDMYLNEIKNVDLLYHEATFLDDLVGRAETTFHSTAKEAGSMANKADVGKLMIGHYSTRYKNPEILLEEARNEFEKTILAVEGETTSITKP